MTMRLLVYRGDKYANDEKWHKALIDLEKAYLSKPPLISLYVNLSLIYADVFPDFEKGLEVCKYVLENSNHIDRFEEIYNNYVHLCLVNGKENAEEYTEFLNEDNSISLSTLALYELTKGNISSAVKKYDKAIKLAKESFKDKVIQRKFYDLGMYYYSQGLKNECVENLKSASSSKINGFLYVNDNANTIIESLE